MELVVRPHVLSNRARTVEDIDYGMTIAEVVARVSSVSEDVKRRNLVVMIDGETIPKEHWSYRRISRSDKKVEIAVVLSGGSGKKILAIVAVILVTIFAPYAAGAITGQTTGLYFAAVKAGIILVGTLMVNAIFAPPRIGNSDKETGTSQTYTFQGQNNQVRRYGRMPRIYGRHRFVPDIAAMPYTVSVGDEQYLYVVYSFGYGPLHLEDFKIGQNPITNYSDYEIVVHENFTSSDQLQLYRNDVWQDQFSFELKQGNPVTVTTQADCDRAIVDIVFAQGLGHINDQGNAEDRTTSMTFEYRVAGSADAWAPATIVDYSVGAPDNHSYLNIEPNTWTERDGGQTYWGWQRGETHFTYPIPSISDAVAGDTIVISGYKLVVQSVDPYPGYPDYHIITTATGLPGDVRISEPKRLFAGLYWGPEAPLIRQGTPQTVVGKWSITRARKGQFAAGLTFAFPTKGQWEIRVTKDDADYDEKSDRELWRRYLTSVKTIKNIPPITPEVPMALVEIKMKATGQLNGNIEQFSAIATSKLKTWNGSAWVVAETRNPAWVYLDLLQGTANHRPYADNRINLDDLKAWAVKCDNIDSGFAEPMGTCDYVVDKEYTLWDLLQAVATTGRAAPTMKDNKHTVLIDDSTRTPVQLFTPRNSWNLQSNRTYLDEPHALRVKWIDPEMDYSASDIIVYNTGYDINSATKFEEMTSFGMTRPEQVTRWGRYMLAQGKLRQERFSIDVDIENIVCVRGDLVMVAHDVMEVGGDPCRIVSISGNGLRVYLDQPPTIGTIQNQDAGMRVRMSNGSITSIIDILAQGNDGTYDYVDLTAPVNGIAAGDLCVFGFKTSLVGEYVVDKIRPTSDLHATLYLEEYAPAVYDAERTGVIPDYTAPGGPRPNPSVTNLAIQLIEFYENGVEPKGSLRVTWKPAQSVRFQPYSYRIWRIYPDGKEQYLGEQFSTTYDSEVFSLAGMVGQEVKYRVRAYYQQYGVSAPEDVSYVFPSRATDAPPELATFTVTNMANARRKYEWTYPANAPSSILGVDIRYVSGDVALGSLVWNSMTKLEPTLSYLTQSGYEIMAPQGAGTFTFLARVVDKWNVLSPVGTRVVAELTAATTTKDTTPPPTPTGFTATGGYGAVIFTCDDPVYTMGGGHDYTQVYAAKYSGTGPLPTFADATAFSTFRGMVGTSGAEDATEYHFWAKWVTRDGVLSVVPAGGTNGVTATTSINVPKVLEALTNQITESQLYSTLASRISLIDGPDTLTGSVDNRIAVETQARITAVQNEATARGTAVTNEQTAREDGDNALAQQISLVTAGVAGGFDYGVVWYFDTSAESWTATGATLTQSQGWINLVSGSTDPSLFSPAGLAVSGAKYPVVKLRVKRLAGTGWDGLLFYTTQGGHGFSGSYYKSIPAPTPFDVGDTAVIEFDMTTLTAGGSDWTASTITQLRIDLGNTGSDQFSIDWIAIGRNAPAASVAALSAETSARVSADSANAQNINVALARIRSNPNILPNGGFENGLVGWNNVALWAVTKNAYGVYIYHTQPWTLNGSWDAIYSDKFSVWAGRYYTITGDSNTDNGTVLFDLLFYDANDNLLLDGPEAYVSGPKYFTNDDAGRAAHASSVLSPSGAVWARARFVWGNVVAPGGLACRMIKVEEGQTWTAYSADRTLSDISASIVNEQTARANADSAEATARLTLSASISGSSGNLIDNSEFAANTDGWAIWSNDAPGNYSYGRNLGGWTVGDGTLYMVDYVPYNVNRHNAIVIEAYTPPGSEIPVVGGKRYQFSAYTGAHRCMVGIQIEFQDTNRNSIGFSNTDTNNQAYAGGTALSGYKRCNIFYTAPANAAYVRIFLLKWGTAPGFNDSYGFFTRAFFGPARDDQTTPDQYAPGGNNKALSSAISVEANTRASETGSLFAKYTVKIDQNGYVSGFGLASTANNTAPVSSFAIRADNFYIANPAGPGAGIAPSLPFIVYSTYQYVNGYLVSPGVYIKDAYIYNGAIDTAKLRDAAITTAKIGFAQVAEANIADLNVTEGKIANLSVTNGKIANLSVNTLKIADGAVTVPLYFSLPAGSGQPGGYGYLNLITSSPQYVFDYPIDLVIEVKARAFTSPGYNNNNVVMVVRLFNVNGGYYETYSEAEANFYNRTNLVNLHGIRVGAGVYRVDVFGYYDSTSANAVYLDTILGVVLGAKK